MDIVLSGIRSTGNLHLGNYYGALQNFIKMQEENKCFFFIADLHSLTTHPDPAMLHENVKNVLVNYLAAGIDPEKSVIYVQSDVPEIMVAEAQRSEAMANIKASNAQFYPTVTLDAGVEHYLKERDRDVLRKQDRRNRNDYTVGLNFNVDLLNNFLFGDRDYLVIAKNLLESDSLVSFSVKTFLKR